MSRMFEKSLFPLLVLMMGTLLSCQRKAEEPVVSPGAGRGQVWFEVSERLMGGETKAAPATIETFTTSPHESFGVVGYAYASGSSFTKTKDASGTMEVSYVSERDRWEPATPVGYSFNGGLLDFYAWYPYMVFVSAPPFTEGTICPTITYTVPTAVADQKDLMVAKASGVTDSPSTDDPVQLTFSHKLTAVKFSIGVGTTCSSITLSGIPGTGTLDMSTGEWSSVGTPATYTITSPTFGSADANLQCPIDEEFTLMLIPQTLSANATLTAETSAGTIIASLACQVWKPGKEVTYKITDPVGFPFSVSATDKVTFSMGNLQYQASTGTWRLAAHQWDYVGDASKGNVYVGETKCDNSQIGATYSGWIDLFGWGTSGHKFASGYGIAYQPWSISGTGTDYGPTDGTSGLTGDYALGDWGVKNMGSGWRTLTEREWAYLLNSRTGNRYCKATVNGVSGLVIFPDSYSHPSGVTAPASVNTSNAAFTSNTWSDAAWTAMEGAGCVFLPVTGQRGATYVFQVTSYGFYWSSTPSDSSTGSAFSLGFDGSSLVNPFNRGDRYNGRSVRLVQDLP